MTPPAPKSSKHEAEPATTLEFAKKADVDLAINATPFTIESFLAGGKMDIVGLSADAGRVYSDPAPDYDAFVVDAKRRPFVLRRPIGREKLVDVRSGVGGFDTVVERGENRYRSERGDSGAALHPRTAIGVDEEGLRATLFVIDGRRSGASEGATLFELGELALANGCSRVLNLDGGGSTTFVVRDVEPSTAPNNRSWLGDRFKVVNRPVGVRNVPGSLRKNGNNLGIRLFQPGRDLTAAEFRAIMPNLKAERVVEFLGPLNRTMRTYSINTKLRRAAFLAQLAHESGEFRYMEEIASGEAYEGRRDLGNDQPGDGVRYKGRGPIQLTGRANYRSAGKALDLPLEANPETASRPQFGCEIAGWYWNGRNLNDLADKKEFEKITRAINGGTRGMKDRERYYAAALKALADDR